MKYIIINLFISLSLLSLSQENSDTLVEYSYYGRFMPISLYSGSGYLQDKIAQSFEIGLSHGVIDIGFCLGNYTQRRDTTTFVEFKITMDAAQYGIYSNEFSLGFGHVFNSKTPLLLEASYTIMAQVDDNFGIGISTGYYDFAGDVYDLSKTYYGLFIRYGLMRDMNGRLNRAKIHHRRKLGNIKHQMHN